nr:SDR family NAD(P)-dependent oxidoreductase [Saccharopolyspora gregorii]
MSTSDGTGPGGALHRPIGAHYPDLPGKVAVITGAARGMGAVFARGLAARGVHVVGGDLDGERMSTTADEINDALKSTVDEPGRVVGTAVDVTSAEQHDRLAATALAEFGRLDHWVNNAGIFPFAPAAEISPDQLGGVLRVNVEGVLYGAQAAARHLGPGGAIVNMSSVSATRVRRGRGAYCTSKAAVAHLTESLAVEFGDQGIRVNAIAPATSTPT